MKYVLATLLANMLSIACAVIAGFLAWKGQDGWGWFLFVAAIAHTTFSFTGKENEQ